MKRYIFFWNNQLASALRPVGELVEVTKRHSSGHYFVPVTSTSPVTDEPSDRKCCGRWSRSRIVVLPIDPKPEELIGDGIFLEIYGDDVLFQEFTEGGVDHTGGG